MLAPAETALNLYTAFLELSDCPLEWARPDQDQFFKRHYRSHPKRLMPGPEYRGLNNYQYCSLGFLVM